VVSARGTRRPRERASSPPLRVRARPLHARPAPGRIGRPVNRLALAGGLWHPRSRDRCL